LDKFFEFIKFIIDLFFNGSSGIFTSKSISLKKIKSEFKKKKTDTRFSQKTYEEEEKEKNS
jgi:hypothetical protein